MTTLQYDSLPQRPPRASRRQNLAPVVGMEEEEKTGGGRGGEGRGAGGGGDEEMTAAATTTKVNNASASAAAADRPPSKHEGAAPAAAPAAVTSRGHLERSRAKRARQGEDREEEEEEDGMEREQADNGGVSTYPASTSSSFSRTPAVPGFDFEYLDHTADIQIHSCEYFVFFKLKGGRERGLLLSLSLSLSSPRSHPSPPFFLHSKLKKNRGDLPRGRLLLRGPGNGQLHDAARRPCRGRGMVRREWSWIERKRAKDGERE